MKDRTNLQTVLDHILFVLNHNPDEFDMTQWVTKKDCWYAACVGGWARVLEENQTGKPLNHLPYLSQAKRAAEFLGIGTEPWKARFREDFNLEAIGGWDAEFDLLFILPVVVANLDEMPVSAEDLAIDMIKYLLNNQDKGVYDAAKIFLFDPLPHAALSKISNEELPLHYFNNFKAQQLQKITNDLPTIPAKRLRCL